MPVVRCRLTHPSQARVTADSDSPPGGRAPAPGEGERRGPPAAVGQRSSAVSLTQLVLQALLQLQL